MSGTRLPGFTSDTRVSNHVHPTEEVCVLDQQTKQQLQENFQQIKPQLKQQFPDLQDQDLQQAQTDPDRLVKAIAQKSGQSESQIEQQVKQLAQQGGRF